LETKNADLQKKLDETPAASKTEVIEEDDQQDDATDAGGKEASEYVKAMNDNFL
jgi:hypothetical protein